MTGKSDLHNYPQCMREETLKRFFISEVSAPELARDVSGAMVLVDGVDSIVKIEDMTESFEVERVHLIELCDAVLSGAFTADMLVPLAFVLLASDTFEWDDDIISEVLSDWSCPEINFLSHRRRCACTVIG